MRCKIPRFLLMLLLLSASACSNDQPPETTNAGPEASPAPTASSEAEAPQSSPAEITDRWLGEADKLDYGALERRLKEARAWPELQDAAGRLLELCRTGATRDERVKAALLLSLADSQAPVPGLTECASELLASVDFQDASFWGLKALGDYFGEPVGFQDLFGTLARPGNEDAALEVLRRLVETPAPEGDDELNSWKLKILHLLAPRLMANRELGVRSHGLAIRSGYFKYCYDINNYYRPYFESLTTADEAVAFYHFFASELFPEIQKTQELREDPPELVTGTDGREYEFDRFKCMALDFQLEADALPRLSLADGATEEGPPTDGPDEPSGRYVVVKAEARPTEVADKFEARSAPINTNAGPPQLDGGLTALLPEPWRAASFSEADRIIYVETTYDYSLDYTDWNLAYQRIDRLGVFDRASGRLLKRLTSLTTNPQLSTTVLMREGEMRYHTPSAPDTEIALAVLGHFRLLPWDKDYRIDPRELNRLRPVKD